MQVLFSVFIWTIGTFLTIFLYFVMLFFTMILFPFDKKRKIPHAQCYWWADILIASNPFWKLEVKGLENIDHQKTYVVIANHQSLADIVVLYKTRMQFKWVAKASLFKVPFIGWCLGLAKHIRLMRGDFSSIKKVYKTSAQWLRSGVSVLFFPEGTRSRTDQMNDFQNGAFKLAIKEKKPILPIVIDGTRDAIPRGSWIFTQKVYGKLYVLPAIETASLKSDEFEVLKNQVREEIEKRIV